MAAPGDRSERDLPVRFLWLYSLAWAPYFLLYGVVLGASMELPLSWAAMGAVANGLPPAILGWWVLGFGRSRSSLTDGPRFWGSHALAAAGYAVACALGTWLLLRAFERLDRGAWFWSLQSFGPVLWQLLVCTLIYAFLAGLGHAVALRGLLHAEETRAARARELAARAQLEAIRARIDPHFLFNTLHSVLALVRRDPVAAEGALERFGDLMHYALRVQSTDGDAVTLGEERDFLAGYIALERLRLADRLQWEERIPKGILSYRLPAFTLQPLVENALQHAVAPRAGSTRVTVSGRLEGNRLILEVVDDGPGATSEALTEGGLGLDLVRQRLQALHGDKARLEIDTLPGEGFLARVRLPAMQAPPEEASA